MKKWNLVNLLMNDNTTPVFDYGMSITLDDGSSLTLYTSQDFINKVIFKYTSWCVLNPGYFDSENKEWVDLVTDRDSAVAMFHGMYDLWRKDKKDGFKKLWEAFRGDYNPLWNVDAVIGEIHETNGSNTGTQEDAHTGHDRTNTEDNGSITKSGSENDAYTGIRDLSKSGAVETEYSGSKVDTRTGNEVNAKTGNTETEYSGTHTNTRTGSETDAASGTDRSTLAVATFDDPNNWHNKQEDGTLYGKTDTKTYNSVTDTESFGSRKDTEKYNNIQDTKTYNNVQDTESFNNRKDTETFKNYKETESFTNRQDTHTYNNVKDTRDLDGFSDTVYDSKNTRTDNLAHYEKNLDMIIRQGNIGVTTSAQLISGQKNLTDLDALIDYMIADFIHNNCIL